MLNVVCFAVVVSKFQQPRSRLVFASHSCVSERDGSASCSYDWPNRRVTSSYTPRSVFYSRRRTRRRGRVLHRAERAAAGNGVLGDDGVLTVSHVIDDRSPLGKYVKDDAFDREAFCDESNALSVTVLGRHGLPRRPHVQAHVPLREGRDF